MQTKQIICLILLVCLTSCKLTSGLQDLNVGSLKRDYWLFLPDKPNPATPLLVLLHDYNSNGEEFAFASGLVASGRESDELPFIIVAPNATAGAFNDGTGLADSVDDVLFIDQLIEQMKEDFASNQVYIAGLGSGANMALRMALESRHELRGITVVAGHIFVPLSDKKPPQISLFLYGNADPIIPVRGSDVTINNQLITVPAASTTINRWKSWLNCGTTVTSMVANLVEQQVWTSCRGKAGMVAMKANGLGHYWPRQRVTGESAPEKPGFGPYQYRIDISLIMLDLIKKHR